jgi:outer membrane protein OmpA-like peptidoglycan-associated protein
MTLAQPTRTSSRFKFGPALAVLLALVLSACAGSGVFEDLDQAQATGSAFSQALFKDYSALARSFGAVGATSGSSFDSDSSMSLSGADNDVADLATAFAQKALDAAKGSDVLPEVAADGDTDAEAARIRLLKSLEDGRDKFPVDAARAQAEYDCWVMNARVDSQKSAAGQCRRSFDGAITQLEHDLNPAPVAPVSAPAPSAPSANYQVYFDFNSWNLTAENLTILQQAIATARSGGQSHITIVGHTDTSGSAGYNQRLSEKRANVVVEALVDMGARREAIQASGVGESDLAVQTGDGVKEPKNRRAVINLVP